MRVPALQATHNLIMLWDAPVTITYDDYTTVDISYAQQQA